MALFNTAPRDNDTTDAVEIGISISCDICFVEIPTVKYAPSLAMAVYECENGHKGKIENFWLDVL